MSKFMKEFKEFINHGNVMDMAIGVIIGGAFTSIVTSLTDNIIFSGCANINIINPLITVITGGNGTTVGGLVVPGTNIDFGAFISAVINFLIVALIVFLLVRSLNRMQKIADKLSHKTKEEVAPASVCPFCLEEVKAGATKCPHCGSDLTKA